MSVLTQERLREVLDYCQSNGNFIWKKRSGSRRPGDAAGTSHCNGYWQISIDRKIYLAHRLAWLWEFGEFPSQQIDHINGVRSDNRISNLRSCSASENLENLISKRQCLQGVRFDRRHGTWTSQISVKGVRKYLGTFTSADAAKAAYAAAKREFHLFYNPSRMESQI